LPIKLHLNTNQVLQSASISRHFLDIFSTGLAVGNSHNYYFGRAEADVTTFVTYFCLGMAEAFATVRSRAELASRNSAPEQSVVLRDLGAQQRRALGLFLRIKEVTRNDVAKFFKLPARQAYLLCQRWLRSGFLVIGNPSTKSRTYRLAEQYELLLIDQQHNATGVSRLQ
jgi:hypothetical protein